MQMIRQFYALSGITTAMDDEILFVLIQNMRDIFGEWKIEQVKHAYELGLNGRLGVDMQLYNKPFNLVFLSELLKGYKSYLRLIPKEEEPTIEKDDIEKGKIAKEAIKTAFNIYKKEGKIMNYGNAIFKLLEDKINLSETEKKEILKEAEIKVKQDLVIEKGAIHSISILEMLSSRDEQTMIDRKFGDIALERFFKKYIKK